MATETPRMSRSRKSAKAAGSRFERIIADCLNEHVSEFIDRKVKTGAKDTGDLANIRTNIGKKVTAELKDYGGQFHVAEWLREAETERVNAGDDCGVVIAKRRGVADPLEQVVFMTVRDLCAFLTGMRPE